MQRYGFGEKFLWLGTAALFASAQAWEGSQHDLASPWGVVAMGPMAWNANPAYWPDAQHPIRMVAGVDWERPYGLMEVSSLLAHAGYAFNKGGLGLAWNRENWLDLWVVNRLRLMGYVHNRLFSTGLAWEPEYMQNRGTAPGWNTGSKTLGMTLRLGSFGMGCYQSSHVEDVPWTHPLEMGIFWGPRFGEGKQAGQWTWSGKMSTVKIPGWDAAWDVAYEWGGGFRLHIGWSGAKEEVAAGLSLPWGAWRWEPHWRNQGQVGRTLGSGLIWHDHAQEKPEDFLTAR